MSKRYKLDSYTTTEPANPANAQNAATQQTTQDANANSTATVMGEQHGISEGTHTGDHHFTFSRR